MSIRGGELGWCLLEFVAYHEGGHALVALHTNGAMPIHKATIMPRGPALGMVMQLPEEQDTMQQSKKQLLAAIDVCMGGIVAEEVIFGVDEVTSGASSDIRKAANLARDMVERYGMSSSGEPHRTSVVVVCCRANNFLTIYTDLMHKSRHNICAKRRRPIRQEQRKRRNQKGDRRRGAQVTRRVLLAGEEAAKQTQARAGPAG